MKKVTFLLVALSISLGCFAQHRESREQEHHSRIIIAPSLSYGLGFGYGYPLYANPYYGYPYYGYPYWYRNPYYPQYYYRMPYQLSLKIQSIRLDYQNQISSARHDKSLSHSQKRAQIRYLKNQRDRAIITAERNYRPQRGRN